MKTWQPNQALAVSLAALTVLVAVSALFILPGSQEPYVLTVASPDPPAYTVQARLLVDGTLVDQQPPQQRPDGSAVWVLRTGSRPAPSLEVRFLAEEPTTIRLSGLDVGYGGTTLSALSAGEIGLATTDAETRAPGDGTVYVGTTGKVTVNSPDGNFHAPTLLGSVQSALVGSSTDPLSKWPERWPVLVLLACAFLAVGLPRRAPMTSLLLAAVVFVGATAALLTIPSTVDGGLSVATAVSGASYAGTPWRGGQIATTILFVGMALLFLSLFLFRAISRTAPDEGYVCKVSERLGIRISAGGPEAVPRVSGSQVSTSAISAAFAGLVIALCAVAIFPGSGLKLPNAADSAISSWDTANLLAWGAALSRGQVPLRDYWYPYGGQGWGNTYPWGDLYLWIWRVTAIFGVVWALRLSARYGRAALCLVAAGVVLLGISDKTSAVWATLPALVLIIAYGALAVRQKVRVRDLGILAGLVAFACWLDPVEFLKSVLVLLALSLVWLGYDAVGRRRSVREDSLRIFQILAAVAAGLVATSILWLISGSLPGNVDFIRQLPEITQYVGSDQNLYGALNDPSFASLVVLIAPAILVTLGFSVLYLRADSHEVFVGVLLCGTGLWFWAGTFRIFVRPEGNQSLVAVGMIVLIAVASLVNSRSVRQLVAAGGVLGLLLAGLGMFVGQGREVLASMVSGPSRVFDGLDYASRSGPRALEARRRMTAENFPSSPDTVILRQLRDVGGGTVPPFGILGDAQLLYVLTDQAIPWQANLYDASPLSQQVRLLRSIRAQRPRVFVWARNYDGDFVSSGLAPLTYAVRDPLVFQYVIRNWTPYIRGPAKCPGIPSVTCSQSDILRPRRPGKPIDAQFWIERLGRDVNLGHIPSYSKVLNASPCDPSIRACSTVVIARTDGRDNAKSNSMAVQVRTSHGSFMVHFTPRKGMTEYPIVVNRLWFSSLGGRPLRFRAASDGMSLKTVGRKSEASLY